MPAKAEAYHQPEVMMEYVHFIHHCRVVGSREIEILVTMSGSYLNSNTPELEREKKVRASVGGRRPECQHCGCVYEIDTASIQTIMEKLRLRSEK